MTTVAAIALAMPVLAQDQQQSEPTKEILQEQTGQSADTAASERAAPPPVTAQEPPAAAPPEPALAEDEQPTPPAEMQFLQVQNATQFLAEEEVIGKDVVNVMDEKVGTIADLVMDQDKKLVGAVLSVGGFLGIGDKWVGVPVDQIDFPSEDQPARLLVAVTEEQLENAPDFLTREEVEAQAAVDETTIPSPSPTDGQ
jgi:hypothetical protein